MEETDSNACRLVRQISLSSAILLAAEIPYLLPFLSLGPVELEEQEEASRWPGRSIPGDYRVGFTTWVHDYEVPLGEPLTSINVWYPTHQVLGARSYLEGLCMDPLVVGRHSCIRLEEGGASVLIFSHGDYSWGAASASLMLFSPPMDGLPSLRTTPTTPSFAR